MENIADCKKLVAEGIPAGKASTFSSIISLAVYIYLFIPFLSWFAFLIPADVLPFEPICNFDMASFQEDATKAILLDITLLLAFMVPHNIFARTKVKKVMCDMGFPLSLERSFFVFQAAFFLHIQQAFWQDFEGPVLWNLTGTPSQAVLAFYLVGAIFLLSSTFALDHFFLFGLSQAFGADLNKKLGLNATSETDGFVTRWHYKLVAHPIMTGVLIVLWATPKMSTSHFLYSACTTLWVVGAVKHLEEPQLKELIGPAYGEYLKTVPRFIPFCPFHFGDKSNGH